MCIAYALKFVFNRSLKNSLDTHKIDTLKCVNKHLQFHTSFLQLFFSNNFFRFLACDEFTRVAMMLHYPFHHQMRIFILNFLRCNLVTNTEILLRMEFLHESSINFSFRICLSLHGFCGSLIMLLQVTEILNG